MLKLCIVAAVVMASSHGDETKELWKRNDRMVKVIDILYDNLAHTVEDSSDKQKRSWSIMITEIFLYVLSDGKNSDPINLDQPADVLVADYRSQMDVFKTVLDPVINSVKRACPPEASDKQCEKAWAEEIKEETKKCPGFPDHLKFYKATDELICGEDYQKFLCEMLKVSKEGNDKSALEFVKELEKGTKYKDILPKLGEWFKAYQTGNFPCNLPPLKDDTCKCSKPPPPAPAPEPEPSNYKKKKNKKEQGFHLGG